MDSLTTPTNAAANGKPKVLPSSVSSSTDDGSSAERPRHKRVADTSDDEDNDSPTKRIRDRIPTFESAQQGEPRTLGTRKIQLTINRPPRALAKPGTGGRTSAKFTKVAEDPGVEGIPPGPRSTERPSQSFACIIGQAILKSSAGGLSLEHIYRYVETAYPYFKTVDQWRNSVRHNLSIHKIFVTIPRTEKHPPGKGGIWVIDDDEKIHWPSEDKFIKTFPVSHPHHAVCRQTLHEQATEQRNREKAAAEGRVYVPKVKGKKGRAKMMKNGLASSALPLAPPPPPPQMAFAPPPPIASAASAAAAQQAPLRIAASLLPSSPPPSTDRQSFDFEDDSDFVPMQSRKLGTSELGPPASLPPPRFAIPGVASCDKDDDENVFSSGPKRVRRAQAEPLSPILEQQPMTSSFLHDDDDMFLTPARERPQSSNIPTSSRHFTSSAMKTPALVQTSSSPTSSPLPPTITRSSHHPSSLQQAWTHDDMIRTNMSASPPIKQLDAAFDLKPMPSKRDRDRDDDATHSLAPHVDRAHPKTPVTRSSAAADRTPRLGGYRTPGLIHKTPLSYGSPARAPPSASALLSTPMWEISGVLERMNAAESPTRTPRTDVPPTSPTHYSLSDCGNSPVAKRRKVAA